MISLTRRTDADTVLFEDEREFTGDENNCFGFVDGQCQIYDEKHMSRPMRLACGTLKCPFYKPKEHKNSIKLIRDGEVSFMTKEEYKETTGRTYLDIEECDDYRFLRHATEEEVDLIYENWKKSHSDSDNNTTAKKVKPINLKYMKKPELIEMAAGLGIDTDRKLKKDDLFIMIEREMRRQGRQVEY